MPKTKTPKRETSVSRSTQKRAYLQQSILPKRKLRDAMLIPQAIVDSFGGNAAPHQVAMAIGVSPTSSSWRDLTGAAVAYGLAEGGYNSAKISLTDLGRRCVTPTVEGDDVTAKAEAALMPQVLRQFFQKYDRSKFPDEKILRNVLQHDFDVPPERVSDVVSMIKDNGSYIGVLHNTKTGVFVALNDPEPSGSISVDAEGAEDHASNEDGIAAAVANRRESVTPTTPQVDSVDFKVFISHGKSMEVVGQVKDVLSLYDIRFEIAEEEETTAIPVPDKVLGAMRRCQAGVMVVTADEHMKSGADYAINNNVLIEVGAAFVLYNKRVVLLWDKRLKVPSNLQGLYRCEFDGDELSFAAGTRLAKAVKGFKTAG